MTKLNKPKLKELIKAANLTYRDLAARIGTRHAVISGWNQGRQVPRLDNAILLASELQVPLKVLCAALGFDVSRLPDDCDPSSDDFTSSSADKQDSETP